jgi:hypothetical protein
LAQENQAFPVARPIAWNNPEPARKVVSIDFASTNAANAAPFCVAITAEE